MNHLSNNLKGLLWNLYHTEPIFTNTIDRCDSENMSYTEALEWAVLAMAEAKQRCERELNSTIISQAPRELTHIKPRT